MLNYEELLAACRQYAKLADSFSPTELAPAEMEPPWSLEPMLGMLGVFRQLAIHERDKIAGLLQQCDERLAPLEDPLRLSFGGHRWLTLDREREETYSDWFAWLISRMDTVDLLELLDLRSDAFADAVRGEPFVVEREVSWQTKRGELKRLDVVVTFNGGGILLIEIKVRSLEAAGGSENLPIYLEYLLASQPNPIMRRAVLLSPVLDDREDEGWQLRSWEQVTIGLRRRAQRLCTQKGAKLLEAAMALCFAGAVEENMLGVDGRYTLSSAPRTASYLEQFLNE